MPKHLALFGGVNAVPLHCRSAIIFEAEQCVDASCSNLDADSFLDVSRGRVIARDLFSISLLVSRIAAYDRLIGIHGRGVS